MRISFRRTFAQFSENYLATHYSGGVSSLNRLAGGPLMIVIGAIFIITSRAKMAPSFFRGVIAIIAILLIIWGLIQTFLPLLNLLLVWLRRDTLFAGQQAFVELEIIGESLNVNEGEDSIELPIEKIKSIQHRTESTWILTEGDYLIAIPREGIEKGDHEKFVAALEAIRYQDEEE